MYHCSFSVIIRICLPLLFQTCLRINFLFPKCYDSITSKLWDSGLLGFLAFCIMKLGGCLPYGSRRNRLSRLDLRFWRSFFQVLRHLERHFHFLSSIYRQENNYSVALLFRNWFLFRPWCLGTLYTSSLRRSFFTAEVFALGQVSPSRINPRGYNLVKPRK